MYDALRSKGEIIMISKLYVDSHETIYYGDGKPNEPDANIALVATDEIYNLFNRMRQDLGIKAIDPNSGCDGFYNAYLCIYKDSHEKINDLSDCVFQLEVTVNSDFAEDDGKGYGIQIHEETLKKLLPDLDVQLKKYCNGQGLYEIIEEALK